MKLEDLQIGDFVSVNGLCTRVELITKKKIGFLSGRSKPHMSYARESLVHPITITPNILIENGFTPNGIYYTYRRGVFNFDYRYACVQFLGEGNVYVSCFKERDKSGCSLRIEYLHQLQQILRLNKTYPYNDFKL